jgi:hypothetical protein
MISQYFTGRILRVFYSSNLGRKMQPKSESLWTISSSSKCRLQTLECLFASLSPKYSRPLSIRTSPRNSGSPKAAEGSRLASRFNGNGKCTASPPRDCENHPSEQAHCHRVAGIQSPHFRGMDICVPKGWHNVRQYHGGQHRIIRFPGIHNDDLIARTSRDGTIPSECARQSPSLKEESARRHR